jgi:hypothetical protein
MSQARAEILSGYKIENGRIVSPGKFEGDPVWVPYFWDLALEGMGTESSLYHESESDDDTGPMVNTFMVQSGDVHLFPELAALSSDAIAISVWEDDNGFVRHEVTTGNDECCECGRRFTATKRDKRAIGPCCK